MVSKHIGYDVASGGLLLLTALAALIVFLIALCMARRRKDVARRWITHFKIAFGLFVFAVVFSFFAQALAIAYNELFMASFKARATMAVSEILRAQIGMDIFGAFFGEFAVVACLVALTGVAAGINAARNGGAESAASDKAKLVAAYVTAFVLGVFNVVAFALNQKHFSMEYGKGDIVKDGRERRPVAVGAADSGESPWETLRAARIVTMVMFAIQLAAGIAVTANAVVVAVQTRPAPRLRKNTVLLLVCCVLLLLRMTYDVGVYAEYVTFTDKPWESDKPTKPGPWFAIVDVILGDWSLFSLLIVMFAMALRRKGGIWTEDEPFMPENPSSQGITMQTPWGYAYSPQSQQPMDNSWRPSEQEVPGYDEAHRDALVPQPAAPAVRHDLSSPPQWQAAPSHHQSFNHISPAGPPLHFSPPPTHDEAMGLYHQADGTPPQVTPLPYNEKP